MRKDELQKWEIGKSELQKRKSWIIIKKENWKEEIHLLQDKFNQFKKKTEFIGKRAEADCKNAESFTKWTKSNHKNA